ncbi:MAG: TIGR03619 family F420-dependent LLM class oxidoreductase [Steroidobacteraceae bacterium]|nr:TIGR03619 family F420-dependent LLM class oxidoreductase [Steroidobacteraceae bacterium]
MRFTLALGLGGHRDYLRIAQAAEASGWSAITTPDSLFYPRLPESEYPSSALRKFLETAPVIEPFVALSAIAAVTTKLQIVPGVLKLPVRRPLAVAKAVSSLAVLSNERLLLGVGLSAWKEDYIYNGVDYEKRGLLCDECIDIIRGCLRGGWFEHHGANFDFGPLKMQPVPERPTPIIVGGHTRPALARAARLGDGWMSANTSFAHLQKMIGALDRLRREYGVHHRDDFRIYANDMNARSVDDFRRLADLGVTDVCTTPWNAYEAGDDLQAKLDGLHRFADTVIARLA